METPVEMYLSQIQLFARACEDPWFAQQLAKARSGDQQARQNICASCLHFVFGLAEEKFRPDSSLGLLNFVQVANNALVETLNYFSGTKAEEFRQEVARWVKYKLKLALEHPG